MAVQVVGETGGLDFLLITVEGFSVLKMLVRQFFSVEIFLKK